jgi:MSHA biogenesis protein MshM
MHLSHFGLKHVPFSKNSPLLPDSQLTTLQASFNHLLQHPGIGLLTGESGVGKTAALRHITQSLNPHQYQCYYLAETQFTSFDIYRQIAALLGLPPTNRFAMLWRDIKSYLKERADNKQAFPVFIIDEAQNLPLNFFRGFPSFMSFDFDARDFMSVWFVGHPELATVLKRPAYTALHSRIT